MTTATRGQLVGFALAHVDDDGAFEFYEDHDGTTPTHYLAALAANERPADVDPRKWPVIEVRIVPEEQPTHA